MCDVIAFSVLLSFPSLSWILQVLLKLMSAVAVCFVTVRSSVSLRTTTRSVPATGTALSTLARPRLSKQSSKSELSLGCVSIAFSQGDDQGVGHIGK